MIWIAPISCGHSLVDVEIASIRCNGRIPGNDRDAGFHGSLASGNERIGVIGGNRQTTGLLGDQGIEQGDLLGGIGGCRTLIQYVDAQFLGSFLCTVVRSIEVRVAKILRNQYIVTFTGGSCSFGGSGASVAAGASVTAAGGSVATGAGAAVACRGTGADQQTHDGHER